MAENNKDNIPECRENDEGLIGIYLNGMSQNGTIKGVDGYLKNVYRRLSWEKKRQFREKKGFTLFIDCLYSHLYQDYVKFKHTRDLGESIRPFNNESKQNNNSNRKPTEAWNKTPIKAPEQQKKNSNNTYFRNKRVSMLEIDEETEEDYVEVDRFGNTDSPETSPIPQQSEYDAQSITPHDDHSEHNPPNTTELHAITTKPAGNSQPNTQNNTPICCFSKLFKNECTRPKCTYSHAPADLAKGYLFYADMLSKSPYKPSGVSITLPREPDKVRNQEPARQLLRLLTHTDEEDQADY
jgi:hypothetical protein